MDNSDEISALTDERLTELLRRGEESAFNALADRYKPMTENAVKRFAPSFSEMDGESVWGEDDLRQCAALALYRAAMTYDPQIRGKDVRFGLYAKICVNNALISELRRAKSAVRRKRRRLEQEKAERKRNESSRRDPLEQAVRKIGQGGGRLLCAQIFCFEILVVEAVEQEIQKIRNDCFRAFRFQ